MISADTKELRQLEKDLKLFNRRGIPYATRDALNTAAFETRKTALKVIDQRMVERNSWTRRSVQIEKSKQLYLPKQEARIGSTQEYMLTQETGGIKTRKGKHGTPIPTSYSSGEGPNAQPRTRLPKNVNRLRNITLAKRRGRYKNQRQRNIATVKQAADQGVPHVFLRYGAGKRGIFEVKGDDSGVDSVKLLYDLSRPAVRVPPTRWLSSSSALHARRISQYYGVALRRQLARSGFPARLL